MSHPNPTPKVKRVAHLKFIQRLRLLLQDVSCQGVIQWNAAGTVVEIHSVEALETSFLPKHFQGIKYKTFVRNLHRSGFRRVIATPELPSAAVAYSCPIFRRDETGDDAKQQESLLRGSASGVNQKALSATVPSSKPLLVQNQSSSLLSDATDLLSSAQIVDARATEQALTWPIADAGLMPTPTTASTNNFKDHSLWLPNQLQGEGTAPVEQAESSVAFYPSLLLSHCFPEPFWNNEKPHGAGSNTNKSITSSCAPSRLSFATTGHLEPTPFPQLAMPPANPPSLHTVNMFQQKATTHQSSVGAPPPGEPYGATAIDDTPSWAQTVDERKQQQGIMINNGNDDSTTKHYHRLHSLD